MSNRRYNFKTENEFGSPMIHQEGSSISYTFNLNDKDSNQAIHVTLLYVALARYGEDWISLPHSHTFTEFFYITNGSGKFSVESEIFDVKSNDLIILIPPRYIRKFPTLQCRWSILYWE